MISASSHPHIIALVSLWLGQLCFKLNPSEAQDILEWPYLWVCML